jgi:hypothetical protein
VPLVYPLPRLLLAPFVVLAFLFSSHRFQMQPLKHELDREAAKTWIYPINLPLRDYQHNIVRRCLFQNTLVALPTGLGKTFIAGVIMLNCVSSARLESTYHSSLSKTVRHKSTILWLTYIFTVFPSSLTFSCLEQTLDGSQRARSSSSLPRNLLSLNKPQPSPRRVGS